MTECGCRKGAVSPGCPRHSVLEFIPPARFGWWHRLLIWFARRGDR